MVPTKATLKFLFLVCAHVCNFLKHWKITNFRGLRKLVNMSDLTQESGGQESSGKHLPFSWSNESPEMHRMFTVPSESMFWGQ